MGYRQRLFFTRAAWLAFSITSVLRPATADETAGHPTANSCSTSLPAFIMPVCWIHIIRAGSLCQNGKKSDGRLEKP